MKFCRDCQYYGRFNLCESPLNGVSFIDGSAIKEYATINRNLENRCGPCAQWFVEQESTFDWVTKQVQLLFKKSSE